jgi:hypothetical protein
LLSRVLGSIGSGGDGGTNSVVAPNIICWAGSASGYVVQLVEVLRYKLEGHWFDPPLGFLRFFIHLNLPAAHWLSDVGTRNLPWTYRQPVHKADCLKILEVSTFSSLLCLSKAVQG